MALETIGLRAVLEGGSQYISDLTKAGQAEREMGTSASGAATHVNTLGKSTETAQSGAKGLLGHIQGLGSGLASLMPQLAGVGAAFAGVFAIKDSISSLNDLAGSVKSLQREMGGSAESASVLHFQLQETTKNADASEKALLRFAKGLAGVSDSEDLTFQAGKPLIANIEALGIAALDAEGHVRPMGEILPQLADSFKEMPNGVEKTALAIQLFGRSGADLLPFLNRGSEGLADLSAEAEKFGLVLDQGTLDAVTKNKLAMKEFHAALEGVQIQLATLLLPAVTKTTEGLVTMGVGFNQHVVPALRSVIGVAGEVISAFEKLPSSTQEIILFGSAFVLILPKILGMIQGLAGAGTALMNFGALAATTKIALGAAGVLGVIIALDAALTAFTGKGLVQRITDAFDQAGAHARELSKAVKNLDEDLTLLSEPAALSLIAKNFMAAADAQDAFVQQAQALDSTLTPARLQSLGGEYDRLTTSTTTYATALVERLLPGLKDGSVKFQDVVDVLERLTPAQYKQVVSQTDVINKLAAYATAITDAKTETDKHAAALAAAGGQQAAFAAATGLSYEQVQYFGSSLAAVKDPADLMKTALDDVTNSIKGMQGAFDTLNPAADANRIQMALVSDQIAILKAKGDTLTAAETVRLKSLEDQLIPLKATADLYAANATTITTLGDTIQRVIGPEGYEGLARALKDAVPDQFAQINLTGQVAQSLNDLAQGSITKAISGFADLKVQLKDQPAAWSAVAQAIGPQFLDAALKGIADPAARAAIVTSIINIVGIDSPEGQRIIAEYRAGGAKVGDTYVAGIISGMLSARANLREPLSSLVGTIQEYVTGPEGIDSNSPSKLSANTVGRPYVEGIVQGIKDGTPELQSAIKQLVDDLKQWTEDLSLTGDAGKTLLADQFEAMIAELRQAVNLSDLSDIGKSASASMIDGWVQAWTAGGSVANSDVQSLMRTLATSLGDQSKAFEDAGKKAADAYQKAFDAQVSAIGGLLPNLAIDANQSFDDVYKGWVDTLAKMATANVNFQPNLQHLYDVMKAAGIGSADAILKAIADKGPEYAANWMTLLKEHPEKALNLLRILAPASISATVDDMVNVITGKATAVTGAVTAGIAAPLQAASTAIVDSVRGVVTIIDLQFGAKLPQVVLDGAHALASAMSVLNSNLKDGSEMSVGEIGKMLYNMEQLVMSAGFPKSAAEMVLDAIRKMRDALNDGKGLANADVEALIQTIINALLNGAGSVADAAAAVANAAIPRIGGAANPLPGTPDTSPYGGRTNTGGAARGSTGAQRGDYDPTANGGRGAYFNGSGWQTDPIDYRPVAPGDAAIPRDPTYPYTPPLDAVPAFASGTRYVPRNMLAYIHQGEAVVPAAYNSGRAMLPTVHGRGGTSGGGTIVSINMQGSTFGDSGPATELMVRRAVRDGLSDVTGRDAALVGVRT